MRDWQRPAVYKVRTAILDSSAGADLHSLSWEGGLLFIYLFVVLSFSQNNQGLSWKTALKQKTV